MYLIIQGRLNEAEESCRSAIERAAREGHGDLPAAGWPHVALARIELERYRLDEAQACLDDGLRIARPGGFGELLRAGRYLRAHIAAARGDLEGALEILQDTERIVGAMDDPYLSGELAWEWTTVCLNTGDLGAARTSWPTWREVRGHTARQPALGARLADRRACCVPRDAMKKRWPSWTRPSRRARASNSTGNWFACWRCRRWRSMRRASVNLPDLRCGRRWSWAHPKAMSGAGWMPGHRSRRCCGM